MVEISSLQHELFWIWGEKTLRIGTSVDKLVVRSNWTLGAAVESARLAQRNKLNRGCSSASPCKTEEAGCSDRKIAPISRDSVDTFLSLSECATSLWIVSEKCRTAATSRRTSTSLFFSFVFLLIDVACVECFHPFCHDCSHKSLCTRGVFNVDGKNSCPNVPSSPVEPDCVTTEVNIVEEKQNTWRRIKKRIPCHESASPTQRSA